MQQFHRLIEILFQFLLEPKEVNTHAHTHIHFDVNGTLDLVVSLDN